MVNQTTIKISKKTVKKLDDFKIHHRETYEDVIKRILTKQEELNPPEEGGDALSDMTNEEMEELIE